MLNQSFLILWYCFIGYGYIVNRKIHQLYIAYKYDGSDPTEVLL